MRVADFVAKFIFEDLKVKHVFTLTGAGIMHLTDGLACNNELKTICPHHEQTSSMALEAYSRATENFGVGLFTTGPGSTNAITGLAGAWQDSVPCMFISGQVKKAEASSLSNIKNLRQFGVQELDIIPIVKPITKYAVTVTKPEDIQYELEKASHIAKSGRPGPVWIEIPMDIQSAQIPKDLKKYQEQLDEQITVSDKRIDDVFNYLKNAKRPVIISGQGIRISKSISYLLEFVQLLGIPVVTPYLGIDTINHNEKFFIGKTGVKGERAANLAMQNSDLIISIGSSLHVSVIGYDYKQFARAAKKIIIDIDEISHKKRTIDIDLFIKGDAKNFLEKLLIKCKENVPNDYQSWLKKCNEWKEKYPTCLPEYKNSKDKINSYYFINQVCKNSSSNDVFVADAGGTFYAVSQVIELTKPNQRYIPSSAMATMGYSLPAAIGISIATNDRVIAFTGDGSLQQNIQEFQTLLEYNLPVKLFVLNNDGYHSIRTSQTNYFEKRYIGESSVSGISFPDTIKVAEAYGLKTFRISKSEDIDNTIKQVLNFNGPVICEVMTIREQEIIPTVASRVNEDGSMSSRPLEDMYPFLDRKEYDDNMFIEKIE
ncbi:thiamine pyrophosphate-binding protein [Candidatus Nitrosopelagicus sp.]|nr:thiamine pyrophosphate-binding protein [Candidatus Nitrosopelagicus sp.]